MGAARGLEFKSSPIDACHWPDSYSMLHKLHFVRKNLSTVQYQATSDVPKCYVLARSNLLAANLMWQWTLEGETCHSA